MKLKEISINLNCYTIRFRKKGNKTEYLTFKEIFGKETFPVVMGKFIDTISKGVFLTASSDRMLRFREFIKQGVKVISGVILKGHNGPESYVEELLVKEGYK